MKKVESGSWKRREGLNMEEGSEWREIVRFSKWKVERRDDGIFVDQFRLKILLDFFSILNLFFRKCD